MSSGFDFEDDLGGMAEEMAEHLAGAVANRPTVHDYFAGVGMIIAAIFDRDNEVGWDEIRDCGFRFADNAMKQREQRAKGAKDGK